MTIYRALVRNGGNNVYKAPISLLVCGRNTQRWPFHPVWQQPVGVEQEEVFPHYSMHFLIMALTFAQCN